ncbi:3-hydroxybutyryl-CoA dehydratase [Variovorax sp. WS11]|uniref:enoyl-CoA hydratase/isomerase family protein n=1 Tax=Variovorax sp. WS11 TaxID=1105204 RepID=UPI000D0CB16C|nr:enoyl-CoA hydratase/isomerase family protein [Variovorax sp. WS11]NDZ17330.1 enoyl-CoA hydratase/isomerase family protein [Variovorax sp. WS11]PSL86130.1 3-hydroxybutyryl-CoA dehydratase [Variovorax sp. WS11]
MSQPSGTFEAEGPESNGPPSLHVEGRIATLRLRRPARANRIEAGDIAVLRAHCLALRAATDVRAVVLTGTGRHFSAGYDIGSVLRTLGAGQASSAGGNAFADMVDAVEALPQVTVCALNGGVFGGATDLALACDFRYGVPQTRMFMPAARLGLHYYPSGLRRYVSRLGLNAAKRLFLLAEELEAPELQDIGYLDAIVPPNELMPLALATAQTAAAHAPLASAGMKTALNALAHGVWDADAVALAEAACLRSADLREGVAAWAEKRVPQFNGH